jgi:superfamily I DNA/RNA helicase/mRNA-degrading endonuclease RelE of RelBE toxin-antitoxin system
MEFRIADTFTDSLTRLNAAEQKGVKTTVFDLQVNPAKPGLQFHKLDKAKDKNFWSVRVSADIRIIVHKTENSLLLCYVDHHDKAYEWAERRRLQTHPKTGAAQMVEIRETVQEIVVPEYIEGSQEPIRVSKPTLFDHLTSEEILSYGVPEEWVEDVKNADEETLLLLADHLPKEAAEALLELATGGKPTVLKYVSPAADPFEHPDAKRRFRILKNIEELERAFAFPWDKWMIFLHPEQEKLVSRDFKGPARVTGSAGTGKTIVALHRAVHLARANPEARVLLATFTDSLARNLDARLRRLIHSQPRLGDRIEVHSLESLGIKLYRLRIGKPNLASANTISELIKAAAGSITGHKFSQAFLRTEWERVVDAWQIEDWATYKNVPRLGLKVKLPEHQRRIVWDILSIVKDELRKQGYITNERMFYELSLELAQSGKPPFDFAVVDEAQDLSVSQVRFFAALGSLKSNGLFFAGDSGQRIFQQRFSWSALGVEVRGRSRNLRVNYRTSHQIRTQADRLLSNEISDVDGNIEKRNDTVSVFNGPAPVVGRFSSISEEEAGVANWLGGLLAQGIQPHEIGIFVRSGDQLDRAKRVVQKINREYIVLDEHVVPVEGKICVSTMHFAKGLEFRAVAVIACDEDVIPLQSRIESAGDDSDLREVYETERQLLYVACTRAREFLMISAVIPGSEFLDDF